jgi:hypothetical protein
MSLSIIIVEKPGILKLLNIKDFKEEELYKKAGFKKIDGFNKQIEWSIKHNNEKISIYVYGKTDGRANSENKYDFPPPIDNKLFFGNCIIIAKLKEKNIYTSLTLEMWEKIYEKLFGGFEDLTASALEDEEEEDELALVPKEKKTKNGYLKDGFVVDSDCEDDEEEEEDDEEEEEEEEEDVAEEDEIDDAIVLEDIGSELSEEDYDYSDSEEE